MIAVHCGAGKHSRKHHIKYKKLCNKACRAAVENLNAGKSALEAAKIAVKVLEDDPLTNAGTGSNLTIDGIVECDASLMDGDTLIFGGCGSVKKVKNPIELAYDICKKQCDEMKLGLIPPSLLVGQGALQHARENQLTIVKHKQLISKKAARQLKEIKSMLSIYDQMRMDTVGAVCCDKYGCVAAACSSGGLLLKKPGRVGQAALYGCGVFADSSHKLSETSVAVSTTGCGEHLVQTQLAKEIVADLKRCECPITELSNTINKKFINSRYVYNAEKRSAGALVMHLTSNMDCSVLWGHTTESMSIGYMHIDDKRPKSIVSEFPNASRLGQAINIEGSNVYKIDLQNKPFDISEGNITYTVEKFNNDSNTIADIKLQ